MILQVEVFRKVAIGIKNNICYYCKHVQYHCQDLEKTREGNHPGQLWYGLGMLQTEIDDFMLDQVP